MLMFLSVGSPGLLRGITVTNSGLPNSEMFTPPIFLGLLLIYDFPDAANPVGSGDSTVAGIASAIIHNLSDKDFLRHANALGMLNAQEKVTGHVNMTNYENLFKQIQVEEV